MAIDEAKIVSAVAGLGITGNEEGLIPAFGLYLTRHMADYYNRISFAFARRLEAQSAELVDDARSLLVEAGHVCAFNTFGGIMQSAEWDAVVAPMIESREDWIRGMVAVINAFGWGKWRVDSLTSGEKLRVTVDESYEAVGWLRDYPKSAHPRCYLAAGGVAGLMNLLYVGDATSRPVLDEQYYVRLFRGGDRFVAEETECLARGDARCTFEAKRVHE
jgi:predicted hydrocarbon binding protein